MNQIPLKVVEQIANLILDWIEHKKNVMNQPPPTNMGVDQVLHTDTKSNLTKEVVLVAKVEQEQPGKPKG